VDTAEISKKSAEENDIKITTFLGSNNYDSGKLAAEFISEKLGDKSGEVAIIEGNPGDTCAIDRTNGFADAAKDSANLTVVASQTGKWDRLESLNVATSILRANPKVCGIYCNNDTMVLGVMQAAADLGYEVLTSDTFDRAGEEKTLLLIGNDGVPEAIQAVQDGTLTGTIAQKPYLMGYSALEAAIIALNGEEAPERFNTPVALVTKRTSSISPGAPEKRADRKKHGPFPVPGGRPCAFQRPGGGAPGRAASALCARGPPCERFPERCKAASLRSRLCLLPVIGGRSLIADLLILAAVYLEKNSSQIFQASSGKYACGEFSTSANLASGAHPVWS
jgi:hypothetical protein